MENNILELDEKDLQIEREKLTKEKEELARTKQELKIAKSDLDTKKIELDVKGKHLNNLDEIKNNLEKQYLKKEEELDKKKELILTDKNNDIVVLDKELISKRDELVKIKSEIKDLEIKLEHKSRNAEVEFNEKFEENRKRYRDEFTTKLDKILENASTQVTEYTNQIEEISNWSDTKLQEEFTKIIDNHKAIRDISLREVEIEREKLLKSYKDVEELQSKYLHVDIKEKKLSILESNAKDLLEKITDEIDEKVEERYSELVSEIQSLKEEKQKLQSEKFDLENDLSEMQIDLLNSEKINALELRQANIELRTKLMDAQRKNEIVSNADVEELKRKAAAYDGATTQISTLLDEKEMINAEFLKLKNNTESNILLAERNRMLKLESKIQKESIDNIERKYNKLKEDFLGTDDDAAAIRRFERVNPKFIDKLGDDSKKISELDWIKETLDAFKSEKFIIDERMFISFHTSLKSADMAPLTVLAGVSGTGKSKLPQLYAKHGGLYFASVPVQPDWDSPQSLLGYYNSIDKTFNATTLLNSIVPFQLEKEGNELTDRMVMVLLDEMNLAYVELYFSEFLSKLEEKRGDENTSITVELGEITKYIKLTNNILWIGTMNEDETTKTLSDKVVDRGNIISFPRPEKLENYRKATIDNKLDERKKIHKNVWSSWIDDAVVFENELDKYKDLVEKINQLLINAGKAVGHRVWQAMQCYIGNHPYVIKHKNDKKKQEIAIKFAFEEAFVHKLVPKLRGIETDGFLKTSCLDEIAKLLDGYTIKIDFDNAIKEENGSFSWNTATYLSKSYDEIEG